MDLETQDSALQEYLVLAGDVVTVSVSFVFSTKLFTNLLPRLAWVRVFSLVCIYSNRPLEPPSVALSTVLTYDILLSLCS